MFIHFFDIAISVLNLPFNSHSPHLVGVGGVQKRGEGSHTTLAFWDPQIVGPSRTKMEPTLGSFWYPNLG